MKNNFLINKSVQGTSIDQYIAEEIAQNNINQQEYIGYVRKALSYNKNKIK